MQWCHSNNDVVATTAPRECRGRDRCRGIGRRRREQRYLYVHGICMSNQVRLLQSVDHSDSQQLTELHWRTRRSCRIRRTFSTLQSSNYHYKCWLLRPGSKAGYCDEHLCLSGCLSASISMEPHVLFSQISVDASNGRGSALLWWHYDMLCTSGFMDDVMFADNGHKLATQKAYTYSDSTRAAQIWHCGLYTDWPTKWQRGREAKWYIYVALFYWRRDKQRYVLC